MPVDRDKYQREVKRETTFATDILFSDDERYFAADNRMNSKQNRSETAVLNGNVNRNIWQT